MKNYELMSEKLIRQGREEIYVALRKLLDDGILTIQQISDVLENPEDFLDWLEYINGYEEAIEECFRSFENLIKKEIITMEQALNVIPHPEQFKIWYDNNYS